MWIHPIISVAYLEQHVLDDWQWVLPEKPAPVLVDGEKQYEIEKIVKQSADSCLVWWCGLDEETWELMAHLQEDVPDVLQQFQKHQWDRRAAR